MVVDWVEHNGPAASSDGCECDTESKHFRWLCFFNLEHFSVHVKYTSIYGIAFRRKIECACALQTQFQFNAAFFPIRAGCCVSAKETLFASSFYSEEKLAVVFIFTIWSGWCLRKHSSQCTHTLLMNDRIHTRVCDTLASRPQNKPSTNKHIRCKIRRPLNAHRKRFLENAYGSQTWIKWNCVWQKLRKHRPTDNTMEIVNAKCDKMLLNSFLNGIRFCFPSLVDSLAATMARWTTATTMEIESDTNAVPLRRIPHRTKYGLLWMKSCRVYRRKKFDRNEFCDLWVCGMCVAAEGKSQKSKSNLSTLECNGALENASNVKCATWTAVQLNSVRMVHSASRKDRRTHRVDFAHINRCSLCVFFIDHFAH